MSQARRIEELSPEELAEVERVESELDAFVEKRARQAKDAENVEELWRKSVEEYHAKRRNKAAEEWYAYHARLIKSHEDTLGGLLDYHRRERARYAQVLGIKETTPIEEKEGEMRNREGRSA